ncbi:MAG TPA: bi-domain-containing oxidoreductase [Cytophagaceae bacterium]|jgi:predicted dehydrogenase/threonine dehydrogenase-like Zn-dependent dehydrogenase|nr:bi-domain-containing oxidoreductase [Cytophagaceae bacterium]
MKQIIQDLKNGSTLLEEVPAPEIKKGHILIQSTYSLVSLGTERMLVEFGKAGWIAKARQQPDKVKQVLDKIKADGLVPTLEAVFNKLDQPLPLGYCNVGKVIAVGEGVIDFKIGDRVASNGQHAEYVCVPVNLAVHVPDEVSDQEASFTIIASIGLQGIRLLQPTFGETIVVTGLGLIGLIAAELLLSNGCRVIGVEIDEVKRALAVSKGIEVINPVKDDVVKTVQSLTHGIGADGVLITASAKNNDIISQAAQMCRKRGRVVLTGVVGLDIRRSDFYEKEITFQVSCSYGPGRYDDDYEYKGRDYPVSFVRWTEKRNFEAILFAIASGKLDVKSLITEVVPLQDYHKIYGSMGGGGSIASLLQYPVQSNYEQTVNVKLITLTASKEKGIAIIGAGNFTKMTLLPALKSMKPLLTYIASAGGVSGTAMAKKYGIHNSTTDYKAVLKDPHTGLVMITTRHQLHASMTIEALQAGKQVFVEKPLALNEMELEQIIQARQVSNKMVMVGFNRRFSPFIKKMKSVLASTPMHIIATMNAGFIPPNVWVHDLLIGGGRIVGEACHFIDLCNYLTGSKVVAVCANALGPHVTEQTDNVSILLRFENGSNAVINYFSNGDKSYSKERVEVYQDGRTLIMDNYRSLQAYGFKGFSSVKGKQDKGHSAQFETLLNSFSKGGQDPIPFASIVNTTQASFAVLRSLKTGTWEKVS